MATVFAVTAVVLIVNVPLVFPAAMTREVAVVALDELLETAIVRPPLCAAEESVTVPVLDFPPLTVAGLRVIVLIVGAVTVSTAD